MIENYSNDLNKKKDEQISLVSNRELGNISFDFEFKDNLFLKPSTEQQTNLKTTVTKQNMIIQESKYFIN